MAGLQGEESISALCRRKGISESQYYSWSKEFLDVGKRRLSGDTAGQATSPEVKDLRVESSAYRLLKGEPLSTIGPRTMASDLVTAPKHVVIKAAPSH